MIVYGNDVTTYSNDDQMILMRILCITFCIVQLFILLSTIYRGL